MEAKEHDKLFQRDAISKIQTVRNSTGQMIWFLQQINHVRSGGGINSFERDLKTCLDSDSHCKNGGNGKSGHQLDI